MSKAEQLAYKIVTQFSLHERTNGKDSLSSYDWKKNDYKLLATFAFEIALKMELPVEKTHKEVAKIINMCIQLEKEAQKIKRKKE